MATTITAVRATPKAMAILAKVKEEKGDDLTNLEAIKAAGPVYIPTVLLCMSTLACIFGASMLNKRQQAALMSAYALLDNSYKEYRRRVIDEYGEEGATRIREAIVRDKYSQFDVQSDDEQLLFYDEISDRYFNSTMEKLSHAEYLMNRNISIMEYVCLNEWYDILGLDPIDGGDEIRLYSRVSIQYNKFELDDGLEVYFILRETFNSHYGKEASTHAV